MSIVWEVYLNLRNRFGWQSFDTQNLLSFNPTHTSMEQQLPPCPGKSPSLSSYNFDTGLEGWQAGQHFVQNPNEMQGNDWTFTTDLPPGAETIGAAYVDAPVGDVDDCDSETAVRTLRSPPISLNFANQLYMSFRHFHTIEPTYDGGTEIF